MAHRELDAAQEQSVPHVSIDYGFMGQDDDETLPIAVIRDHAGKFTFSHVVPCKGVETRPKPCIPHCQSLLCSCCERRSPNILAQARIEPSEVVDIKGTIETCS